MLRCFSAYDAATLRSMLLAAAFSPCCYGLRYYAAVYNIRVTDVIYAAAADTRHADRFC